MAKTVRELKKGKTHVSNFNLVGACKVNDYTFSMGNESQKSSWVYHKTNLGIDCGRDGIIYASMMGGYSSEKDNVVYVHGTKENENKKTVDDFENRYTIDWDDRFNETILKDIGDLCFIQIGIEKDIKGNTVVKKFLSQYDAIEYLQEHIEDGMVLNVKGKLKYSEYEGSLQINKEIESIFLSKAEEDKYRATFEQTVLFDYNSIGKKNKDNNTYYLAGYIMDYVGKVNGKKIGKTVVYSKTFEFPIGEDVEKTQKILVKFFKPKKKGLVAEVNVRGRITKGGNTTEVSLDDIPEDILELIELGLYTQDDIKGIATTGGKSAELFLIEKPIAKKVKKDDGTETLVIQVNPMAYDEESLVFLSSYLIDDEEEKVDNEDVPFDTDDDSEDDDFAGLFDDED